MNFSYLEQDLQNVWQEEESNINTESSLITQDPEANVPEANVPVEPLISVPQHDTPVNEELQTTSQGIWDPLKNVYQIPTDVVAAESDSQVVDMINPFNSLQVETVETEYLEPDVAEVIDDVAEDVIEDNAEEQIIIDPLSIDPLEESDGRKRILWSIRLSLALMLLFWSRSKLGIH